MSAEFSKEQKARVLEDLPDFDTFEGDQTKIEDEEAPEPEIDPSVQARINLLNHHVSEGPEGHEKLRGALVQPFRTALGHKAVYYMGKRVDPASFNREPDTFKAADYLIADLMSSAEGKRTISEQSEFLVGSANGSFFFKRYHEDPNSGVTCATPYEALLACKELAQQPGRIFVREELREEIITYDDLIERHPDSRDELGRVTFEKMTFHFLSADHLPLDALYFVPKAAVIFADNLEVHLDYEKSERTDTGVPGKEPIWIVKNKLLLDIDHSQTRFILFRGLRKIEPQIAKASKEVTKAIALLKKHGISTLDKQELKAAYAKVAKEMDPDGKLAAKVAEALGLQIKKPEPDPLQIKEEIAHMTQQIHAGLGVEENVPNVAVLRAKAKGVGTERFAKGMLGHSLPKDAKIGIEVKNYACVLPILLQNVMDALDLGDTVLLSDDPKDGTWGFTNVTSHHRWSTSYRAIATRMYTQHHAWKAVLQRLDMTEKELRRHINKRESRATFLELLKSRAWNHRKARASKTCTCDDLGAGSPHHAHCPAVSVVQTNLMDLTEKILDRGEVGVKMIPVAIPGSDVGFYCPDENTRYCTRLIDIKERRWEWSFAAIEGLLERIRHGGITLDQLVALWRAPTLRHAFIEHGRVPEYKKT